MWVLLAVMGFYQRGNFEKDPKIQVQLVLWNFKVLVSVQTVPKYSLTRTRSNPQGLVWM